MSSFNAIGADRDVARDEYTPAIEPQATWCPGCGDFGVLKALKGAMAELGRDPEEILLVTGIGCSGKLSSYFESYGLHTIHGPGDRERPAVDGVEAVALEVATELPGTADPGIGRAHV